MNRRKISKYDLCWAFISVLVLLIEEVLDPSEKECYQYESIGGNSYCAAVQELHKENKDVHTLTGGLCSSLLMTEVCLHWAACAM